MKTFSIFFIIGYGKVVSPVSTVLSHGYAAPAIAAHSYAAPAYGLYYFSHVVNFNPSKKSCWLSFKVSAVMVRPKSTVDMEVL